MATIILLHGRFVQVQVMTTHAKSEAAALDIYICLHAGADCRHLRPAAAVMSPSPLQGGAMPRSVAICKGPSKG